MVLALQLGNEACTLKLSLSHELHFLLRVQAMGPVFKSFYRLTDCCGAMRLWLSLKKVACSYCEATFAHANLPQELSYDGEPEVTFRENLKATLAARYGELDAHRRSEEAFHFLAEAKAKLDREFATNAYGFGVQSHNAMWRERKLALAELCRCMNEEW